MNDFYIDRLPSHCDYLSPHLFIKQPNFEAYLQIVDNRWTAEEVQKIVSSPISPAYSDFFEVVDIASNVDGSENWVCGLSVFFLKNALNPTHEYRESPETHEKLIDGVQALIEYPDRSQETVLRFYVSPEAWEAIAKRGLFNEEHTQFYKMRHASEDSQIGTMWRLLALDDPDYEYAIETDVAPDEEWIFARLTDWEHNDFLKRLSPDRFYLAGEIQSHDYQRDTTLVDGYSMSEFTRFDHLTAGGIVTIPRKMPPLVPLFCKFLETSSALTLFNCELQTWTRVLEREHFISGWQALGPDQNVWRFLKRSTLARHAIYESFAEAYQLYPSDHYFIRMVRQFEKSGHEFIIDGTEQRLLEFLES